MQTLTLENSVSILKADGILVYPTETFWAIGCLATSPRTVDAIFRIKKRAPGKPFPLIACSLAQVGEFLDLTGAPESLPARFWPGSLSVLLPAKSQLAPGVINRNNKVAVRISPARLPTRLAAGGEAPLVATSANESGEKPATDIASLNGHILAGLRESGLQWGIVSPETSGAHPAAPSTLVDPIAVNGRWQLKILREGAIKRNELINCDWDLL